MHLRQVTVSQLILKLTVYKTKSVRVATLLKEGLGKEEANGRIPTPYVDL